LTDSGIAAGLAMQGLGLGDDLSTAVQARNEITDSPLHIVTGSGRAILVRDGVATWGIGTTGAGVMRILPNVASALEVQSDINIFGNTLKVSGTQVVEGRKTGWAGPTGTATRTTFATSTVTTEQLAERVKALVDDLTSHGLIGA
jgi:hypothetical protein